MTFLHIYRNVRARTARCCVIAVFAMFATWGNVFIINYNIYACIVIIPKRVLLSLFVPSIKSWGDSRTTKYTRTTFETPKYHRRPKDQYTAQTINTLELSAPHQNWGKKNPLQPGNQPGEASNNKYMYICSSKKWSHCETVALWNSLGTCKTSSIPLRCHWKPNCQRRSSHSLVAVLLLPLFCHVHLQQYSWFDRIFSAVANLYRKSSSLLKRSVSIISIFYLIKFINIAFQSVSCIHAEWAILGDDVGAASRRLIFLSKYRGRP